MTQEEILYDYFLKLYVKYRNEAIELLKIRNFKLLNLNYIHWFDKKEKIVNLDSSTISDVVTELLHIKVGDNESEPILTTDDEDSIILVSYIYSIVPSDKCEIFAKNETKSAMFKLEHQPNGIDAERYKRVINSYDSWK